MRSTPPFFNRFAALVMLGTLACLAALSPLQSPLLAAQPTKAPPAKKAESVPKAEPAQKADPVDISGRIAVGLDKVFIKDDQGYCLVQGLDLTPFAGRRIRAKGVVIRQDQEYRTVRLLEYSIMSPDDDSPSTAAAAKQTGEAKGAAKQVGGSGKTKR